MPPTDPAAAVDAPAAAPRRRTVFPYVWTALLAGAWGAFQFADVTVDFKNIATLGASGLLSVGLAVWFTLRGPGRWPVRLAVATAPFVAVWVFNQLFEIRFNGAGAVVGLHRRGDVKEDQLLAKVPVAAAPQGLADWGPGPNDYPRFLGSGPFASAVGPALEIRWDETPPKELWRREVGAGWSSFAVQGAYAVTQEQRGDEELVVCYRVETGEPVWSHADAARFDPGDFAGQMGRQGPRATPTIVGDRVYTQGATGLVNCLDGATGEPVWSVDTGDEFGAVPPVWGKSGSPLYVPAGEGLDADVVVVNVGAPLASTEKGGHDASVVAFRAETGEVVWRSGWRQTSYGSPLLATLGGERVVLQTGDNALEAFRASDGEILFDHPWNGTSDNAPACSQPVSLGGDRILLTKGYGHGASLLGVKRDGDSWSVEPRWTPAIKPVLQTKYSNVALHNGYAYGLHGEMLHCVEVETGKLAWRKRRTPNFGFGQVLLVGDYVLVQCEESGEVVLLEANPERYVETAALRVLTEGEVCWNNPVITGDVLLVRNSIEAAAYRLPLAPAAPPEDGN